MVLVAGLSYLLLTAFRSPEYFISSVSITGLNRLSEEEVLAELDLIGKHIFTVQPEDVRSVVSAAFPEFWDIRVGVSLPAKVSIRVTERQPMFTWETGDTLMWIDTEGYLIPARGTASEMLAIKADALPVYRLEENLKTEENISKIIQDKSIEKPGLSSLNFFAQPKHLDSNLLAGVLQLNAWMPEEPYLLYQKQRGLGWEDVRGWDVFVGAKLENINDKMVMYETIVRELEDQGIDPSVVSVEFLYAPYYRVD